MKLIVLSILLGILQCPGDCEVSFTAATTFGNTESLLFQDQLTNLPADSVVAASEGKEKIRESRLEKTLDKLGKFVWLLLVAVFAGIAALLRYADRIIRHTDNLLLRIQRRPNIFDSFRFTGNPFILKGPFYAIYHIFMGRCAYRSYQVWPLKYTAAITFMASIVFRLFRDEAFIQAPGIQTFLGSPRVVQISAGLILLLYLAVLVLLSIESYRKTKWYFPLRLLIFLVPASIIAFLIHKLFWLIVGLIILYLATQPGKDYITRQKNTATKGYPPEDFIYEPWSDRAENPNTQ